MKENEKTLLVAGATGLAVWLLMRNKGAALHFQSHTTDQEIQIDGAGYVILPHDVRLSGSHVIDVDVMPQD